jgi:hypothetical protein
VGLVKALIVLTEKRVIDRWAVRRDAIILSARGGETPLLIYAIKCRNLRKGVNLGQLRSSKFEVNRSAVVKANPSGSGNRVGSDSDYRCKPVNRTLGFVYQQMSANKP